MIRVMEWKLPPGETYPVPLLQDDAWKYPPELVKNVRAWLKLEEPKMLKQLTPTDQILGYQGARFLDAGVPKKPEAVTAVSGVRAMEFESGTFEVLLKKRGVIIARYHWAGAREVYSSNVILGSMLWWTPEGQL